MKIDQTWLENHNACPEEIEEFLEWAGDEPRSLEEIADHHPDCLDLAWLLDLLAPFEWRQEIACRIAGEAAGIFLQQPEGDRHWWYARNINPGNIGEAEAEARTMGASALADLYHDASNGKVVKVFCAFEDYFVEDLNYLGARVVHRTALERMYREQTCTAVRDNLRTALRLMHRAQTCLVERPLTPKERSAAAVRVGKAYQMMNGDVIWLRRQTEEGLYEALQQFIIRADEWGEEHGWMPCEYLMHPDQFAGAVPATAPQPGETITIYRPLLGSTVSCLVGE
jgi:hypothetical protein